MSSAHRAKLGAVGFVTSLFRAGVVPAAVIKGCLSELLEPVRGRCCDSGYECGLDACWCLARGPQLNVLLMGPPSALPVAARGRAPCHYKSCSRFPLLLTPSTRLPPPLSRSAPAAARRHMTWSAPTCCWRALVPSWMDQLRTTVARWTLTAVCWTACWLKVGCCAAAAARAAGPRRVAAAP